MFPEIRIAAKASLFHYYSFKKDSTPTYISGSGIFKLIRYRKQCVEAVKSVISTAGSGSIWRFHKWCTEMRPIYSFPRGCNYAMYTKAGVAWISNMFQAYLEHVASALQERPHPQVIFDEEHHDRIRGAAYRKLSSEDDSVSIAQDCWERDIEAFEREFAIAIDTAISNVCRLIKSLFLLLLVITILTHLGRLILTPPDSGEVGELWKSVRMYGPRPRPLMSYE